MNNRALTKISGELITYFRRRGGPADRATGDFLRARKFLGSRDRRFVGDAFFHTLRHLRRIDEAIESAFSGLEMAMPLGKAGFPVTNPIVGKAWQGGTEVSPFPKDLRRDPREAFLDTLRAAIAAAERHLALFDDLIPEIVAAWPQKKGDDDLPSGPTEAAVERMIGRAREVASIYREERKPALGDRTYSFPAWLWAQLGHGIPGPEATALAQALNEEGPITLRVNTLKATREQGSQALTEAGIEHTLSPWSPDAIILAERAATASLPHFDEGWFEFQDEASQLCARLALPHPGDVVLDVCAGGGGKTLALAALMRNEGRLIAHDIDATRLEGLEKRRARSGATILEFLPPVADPAACDVIADVVLIDAPCSGVGTLRRNPERRWSLTPAIVSGLCATQAALLDQWCQRVTPGGLLIYATCSLLNDENAAQVDAFLARNKGFRRDTDGAIAALGGPENAEKLLTRRGDLALFPHRHGADGFFAARLRRVG